MGDWIERLNLQYLDHESGLYSVEHISDIQVDVTGERLPASSCIYYALTREHPQNHLHWLASDDHHILIEGGPADYFLFLPDGSVRKETLGLNGNEQERPLVIAPGGTRKAVRLGNQAESLLVASVVTPAWTPERVSFGAGRDFIEQYVGQADWATPAFLKSLIGPNWQDD